MKLIDLLEARRNTPQNPKFSQLIQLIQIAQKYGTKNIYCRFVNVPMLKNTILTKYDTPLGMCSYPLQYVIDKEMDVPFAGTSLYLLVFKPKSTNNIWKLDNSMLSTMIPRMLKAISKILWIKTDQNKQFNTDKELWYYMYDRIRSIPQHNPALVARQILTSMGLTGVDDYMDKGIIHKNEPTQALFFNASDLQLLSVISNLTIANILSGYWEAIDMDIIDSGSLLNYINILYLSDKDKLRIAARVLNHKMRPQYGSQVLHMVRSDDIEKIIPYGFNVKKYKKIVADYALDAYDPGPNYDYSLFDYVNTLYLSNEEKLIITTKTLNSIMNDRYYCGRISYMIHRDEIEKLIPYGFNIEKYKEILANTQD